MTAAKSPERLDLERRAAAVLELERRRRAYPLAYADLWHHEDPNRTSQRRAVLALTDPETFILLILGGNRSGKSRVLAMLIVAMAAGLDAYVEDEHRCCRVYYVREWLARNHLPESLIPTGPGRVWVGSPTFASACEQIRPHIAAYLPDDTRFSAWHDKSSEGEAKLAGGGVIVSKAYKQYLNDPQSWEGAAPRFLALDEEPASRENLAAAMSRTVDHAARIVIALTQLNHPSGWFNQDLVVNKPPYVSHRYIYARDNPHVSAEALERMLAAVPAWQRPAREFGIASVPAGAIYRIDRAVHVVDPFDVPTEWVRWVGVDWGGRAPHVVWAAESPTGDLYVYAEVAPRRTTLEPAISDRRLIEWIRETETASGLSSGTIVYRVADSEAPGAIIEAASQGLLFEAAAKGAGSVVAGIQLVDALLAMADSVTGDTQRPRLFFLAGRCPKLLEEMEGLRWADQREGADPRPDPASPDHGPDALRYIVQSRAAMGFR